MTGTQILVFGLLALLALFLVRRFLLIRSLTLYSPTEVAAKLKNNENLVLLDVRTSDERQHGSIKGSIHIPLHDMRKRIDELNKHKSREVICYCASGNRSVSAAAMLQKAGFKTANMKGGFTEWNLLNLQS